MPTNQQYATNVPQTTLTGLINPTATSLSVFSSSGWPSSFPFTAILDIGTSTQEPVDVTNIVGTTWTVTRAIDGTVGFTHQVNATVTHGDTGRDFREARSHIDASTTPDAVGHSVHGLASSSSVVGTTDSQVLTNKTITAGTFTGAQAMGTGNWSGSGILQEAALAFSGLSGASALTARIVGAVNTGAAPVSGTFITGDVIYDTVYHTFWVCTSGGTPGTWLPMGNRAALPSAAPASVTVPSWANMVRLTWNARCSSATANGETLSMQINGDSASHYTWQNLTGNVSTAGSSNAGGLVSAIKIGIIPDSTSTANYFGTGEVILTNCQGSTFKAAASTWTSSLSNSTGWTGTGGGTWESTAAITSLNIFPASGSFSAGSSIDVEFRA